MRKFISILFCLLLIMAVTGCKTGNPSAKPGSKKPAGVNEVLQQGMAEEDRKNAGTDGSQSENTFTDSSETDSKDITYSYPEKQTEDTIKMPKASGSENNEKESATTSSPLLPEVSYDEPDIDLTVLSATMVYSEVYNMMVSPEEYIGKTIKMKGPFSFYHDEITDNNYFACIIQDATACCAQGIEFILTEDYSYPDDYPRADEEICVVGVFDTYLEDGYEYCTLRNAKLL